MRHLYSVLLCIAIHPKCFTIIWAISPQPPPVYIIHLDDATAAIEQRHHRFHHTPATGREERDRANPVDGDYWEAIFDKGQLVGIWPGHQGYTQTLHEKYHEILNDHRESGPRFTISTERRCFLNHIIINHIIFTFQVLCLLFSLATVIVGCLTNIIITSHRSPIWTFCTRAPPVFENV